MRIFERLSIESLSWWAQKESSQSIEDAFQWRGLRVVEKCSQICLVWEQFINKLPIFSALELQKGQLQWVH